MEKSVQQRKIVRDLQQRILAMQGFAKPGSETAAIGLGALESAFPQGVFPLGAIHEFVSPREESAAATSGFITCLLNRMGTQKSFSVWISSRRHIFPPALKLLGVDPESIIFVDLQNDKDVLWAVEESLRCKSLKAVIGEVKELNFSQSRRLQLAIEESRVTGFIHRVQPRIENATACVARWKITPLPGISEEGMPGVGFPKWNVELAKVRNGKPGAWELGWTPEGFQHFPKTGSGTAIHPETAKYA